MQLFRSVLFGLAVMATTGCHSDRLPTYPVSGTIQYADGKPVTFGYVEFYCQTHDITARGPIAEDGSFQLSTFQPDDGAVAGQHQVIVTQVLMPQPVVEPGATAARQHQHDRHLPQRYASFATSDLRCEVTKGDNACELVVAIE